MKFEVALKYLLKGKKIRRKIWAKEDYYKLNSDGYIVLSREGSKVYEVNIYLNEQKIMATDWMIVKEKK